MRSLVWRGAPAALVILVAATASAEPRKVAGGAVALSTGLEGEAIEATAAIEAALSAEASATLVSLQARAGASGERREKGGRAAALLPKAIEAFDGMEFAAALGKAREAQALAEESDLRETMPVLLDALALESMALLASGKALDAKNQLNKLLTLRPGYGFNASRLTPEASKVVNEVKAKLKKRAKAPLEVKTSPVPALVFVDGELRGTSPVVIRDLVAGSHFLTVVATGYAVAQEKGFASPGGGATIALQPLPSGVELAGHLNVVRESLAAGSGVGPVGALARWADADEAVVLGLRASGEGLVAVGVRADAKGRSLAAVEKTIAGRGAAARAGLEAAVRELMAVEAPRRESSTVARVGDASVLPPPPPAIEEKAGGRSQARWIAGWALVGVGVAAAGGGIGLGVNVNGLAAQAKATPQVDRTRYDQLVNDGKTQGYVADALFGVAAVGAVAGIVLLVTSGSSGPAPAPDAVAALAPVPGGASFTVSGRF